MLMALFKKVEDDIDIIFIQLVFLDQIHEYFLSFGNDLRMIVSPVNLQQQVILVDEGFNGFWFYLGGEVGASPADFTEKLHCVQFLL